MAASQMKLFGTTILFPQAVNETHFTSAVTDDYGKEKEQSLCFEDSLCSSSVSDEDIKKLEESEFTKESNSSNAIEEVLKSSTPSIENPKTPSSETEPDLQNEHSETKSESSKKPDKLLPCPRCDSADTKFCYYNNYNLTQPRYFCKNCQRYWTSGGTMRNVPVGSGRRKSKHTFDSQYFQIMAPEYFQSQAYGKVLDFGSNTPTSFVSKQNFDLSSQFFFQKGFLGPQSEKKKNSSGETGDDRSSITSSGSIGKEDKNNYVIQESVDVQNFQKNLPMMFYQSHGILSYPFFYPQNRNSQILGKHSREREVISNLEENNLWYPKASRIDDPNEGAKRSIWSSLGIKNEKSGIKGKVLFEAFRSNDNDEQYVGDNSLVLQANPAALARSHNFHEIV